MRKYYSLEAQLAGSRIRVVDPGRPPNLGIGPKTSENPNIKAFPWRSIREIITMI